MRQRILFLVFLLTSAIFLHAQDSTQIWTLEDCINYAIEHNIQVEKSRINQLSGEEDVALAKAQLFPSLSGSVSQNFTNYPSKDVESNNIYSGTYGINSSLKIFDGGKRTNAIKQQKLNNDINKLSITENENSIKIAIIQAYMQVLYANESVKTNENTVEVSKVQRDRAEEFLKAGSISQADFSQMESQYISDKYKVISAKTTLDNYKLQLKQLLELDITDDIEIYIPELAEEAIMKPLSSKEEIYTTSLSVMPEIQSSKLNTEIADLEIKSAKAGYLPSLSLNAAIGTGNSSGSGIAFGDQIWNRFNENIGLTISIPIYSNRENKTAVNKAKYSSIISQLDLLNAEKDLLKTVEGIYLDAISAQSEYPAALEQAKAMEDTYELTSEQFTLGMKNTLELLTAKNNLLNAQQEMLQSKYMAAMSIQLLNIYTNKEIQLIEK